MSEYMTMDESWRALGIQDLRPGFYDHPCFIEAEKGRWPNLLDVYALYVRELPLQESYLSRARSIISEITAFVYGRLVDSNSLAECVFVSKMLSRMLDEEGLWNVPIVGGFTSILKSEDGLVAYPFAPREDRDKGIFEGHAWVYAPPYQLIDLTAWLQPYPPSVSKVQACPLLFENVEPLAVDDFPDNPARKQFASLFTPFQVRLSDSIFRYAPRGVRPAVEPLAGLSSPLIGDQKPQMVYQQWLATASSRD